jgi:hypothetical protein
LSTIESEADVEDLQNMLYWIAKEKGEQRGRLWPMEPQQYIVTVAPPDDESVIPALQQKIEGLSPGSPVLVARFPGGRSGDKLRLLTITLLEAARQPTPTRGQSTYELSNRAKLVLWQQADFLIMDNAHLLNLHCLHFLRRDQGTVPAILVGRNKRLLITIRKDEMISRRSLFLEL